MPTTTNFVFFVGHTDIIPDGHVPDSVEYTLLWDQLVAAPNFGLGMPGGGGGGTYVPDAFVSVGGAGFRLAGTGHELMASSGRLTVQPGAEIRLPDTASAVTLPTIKVNGSGGDILLYVKSHISTLEVKSGALAQINAGGALDIYGALTLKSTASGGPGTMSVQSGASVAVASGATVNLNDGSTTNLNGALDVQSTGAITLKNGSNFLGQSGSFSQWSGTQWFAGTTVFVSNTWPELTPARSWERRSMDIALVTYESGSAPADVDAWVELSNISTGPCVRTANRNASGAYLVIEFKNLPPGGTLGQIDITTNGITTTLPTYPQYQIVRWKGGDLSTLSSLVTDEHSGTGDWGTNNQTTTITPTSTHTVDSTYRYGLMVIAPYAAAGSSMRIFECAASGTTGILRT